MENSDNVDQTMQPAKASAKEIHTILAEHPDLITEQLNLNAMEVSLPLDQGPVRVLVRVEPGDEEKVPASVFVNYQARQLEVPLEASGTYEPSFAQ